jgi:hypothetical protein
MSVQRSLRSLVKWWNDASLKQLANLREPRPTRRWPLVGIFALGLVAGVIGSYALARRSELKRLAELAYRMKGGVLDEADEVEEAKPVSVTSRRSNHRRKAPAEVK